MNQRLIAALVAIPAVLGLLAVAAFTPLEYTTYRPGATVDVLGQNEDDDAIIQVSGREVFRDDGQLRMTTVGVSPPRAGLSLLNLVATWFDPDEAVYPESAVYGQDETPESNRRDGAVQMVTSQDTAIEVALAEMGIEVPQTLQVAFVEPGSPAENELEVRDTLLAVDGEPISDPQELVDAVRAAGDGGEVAIDIRRDGEEQQVMLRPSAEGQDDDVARIGVTPGIGYDFPFEVELDIDPRIGGPSAGLMFSLAVYDTLTRGSLTGGRVVAGSGTIAPGGEVGPIGGIQQKIAGARDDGAALFLVPAGNCSAALGADPGDMRLVRAETMGQAREALEEWAADPDVDLPSCEDDAPERVEGS